MGNVVAFIITILDRYTPWIYLVCFFISLLYFRKLLIARRSRNNSPYTIEREVAAHKEGKALIGIGVMLALAVLVAAVKMFVLPGIDITKLSEPTPTLTLPPATKVFATLTPAPTITITQPEGGNRTPVPTVIETAIPEETPTAEPEPTQAAPAANCPTEGVVISSPGAGEIVSGQVTIFGTANIDGFQFFKLEYSPGERPGEWRVIGNLQYQAVSGGVLGVLNSSALPNGIYWLQLTVVDQTGNFPAPCQVRITIQN
ncbi:MAG: hypothetical protein LLG44_05430 [Chloroflexi bacterium]|nr:hypothetical protein [Chloroflexota bacterium]